MGDDDRARAQREMQSDQFIELARARRCVHRFKSDPIPDAYIERIIEPARWAMSGGNAQPWEFIVVKDLATRKTIADLYVEARRSQYPIEMTRREEVRHHLAARDPSEPAGFRDAPVVIVVCGDRRTLQASVLSTNFITEEGAPNSVYLKNMANATQNLHLAARALGLGSQWVSVNCILEQPLKALLDVPAELTIHTMVPVGYPAGEPPAVCRREQREIVHFEKYDRGKFRSGEDIIRFLVDLRRRMKPTFGQKSPG